MKLTEKIKSVFSKIGTFFGKLFGGIKKELIEHGKVAVDFVNVVKTVNDSFTGDIIAFLITNAIPGSTDDRIVTALRKFITNQFPLIAVELEVSIQAANAKSNKQRIIIMCDELNRIANSSSDNKKKVYLGLAAMALNATLDKKITLEEAKQVAQYVYDNRDKF